MLCHECSNIGTDPDRKNGLTGPNGDDVGNGPMYSYKLKDTLDLLRQSALHCGCCDYISRAIPVDKREAQSGAVYLARQYSDIERLGIVVENGWFDQACFNISTTNGNPSHSSCNENDYLTKYVEDEAAKDDSIVCRNVGRHSGDQQCTDFIALQLRQCESSHQYCSKAGVPNLPTRILDLGASSTTKNLKLLVDNQLAATYAALSHCWGPPSKPIIKTLQSNLEQRQDQITFEELTPVFQDAVTTARALGFRYLWIDALCIIQDSQADWAAEAGRMSSVYQNASLTIAAACSASSYEHFLRERTYVNNSCKIPYKSHRTSAGYIYLRPQVNEYHNGLNHKAEPLQKRAWTYQEQLLSPRVIYYDEEQLVWECNAGMVYENCTKVIPFTEMGKHRGPVRESNKDNHRFPKSTSPATADIYRQWYSSLKNFGQRQLTFSDDALPALSGVATRAALAFNDTYLGGIWKGDFQRGLLWTRKLQQGQKTEVIADGQTRPARSLLAPSWSWASVPAAYGPLSVSTAYGDTTYPLKSPYDLALIDAEIVPKAADPRGQLTRGILKVRGYCTTVQMSLEDKSTIIFKQDHGFGVNLNIDISTAYADELMTNLNLDAVGQATSPDLLCLAVGQYENVYPFKTVSLHCLLLKATTSNEAEYSRVGVVCLAPPLDPAKKHLPPGKMNFRLVTFDGTLDDWEEQTITII